MKYYDQDLKEFSIILDNINLIPNIKKYTIDDEVTMVEYDPNLKTYTLKSALWGAYEIFYCPWCGKKLKNL